jgi:hypothetical protein
MSSLKVQKLYGVNGAPGTSPYIQVGDNGEVYPTAVICSTPFILNAQTIGAGYTTPVAITLYNSGTSTWTIPGTYNAMSAGKVTINTGYTVNVATGARWTII